MTISDEQIAAATALAELDAYCFGDLAEKLTCDEADVFAEFLRKWRDPEFAEEFLALHAEDDDEDDAHFEYDHSRAKEDARNALLDEDD